MSTDTRLAALLPVALVLSSAALAQRTPPPQPTVLTDVRLSAEDDAPRVSIVIRNGRITEILREGVPAPPGHLNISGLGALALPAFIDACSTTGCETPTPTADRDMALSAEANVHIDMRQANRKGIQPTFRAVDALVLSDAQLDTFRGEGFAVLHTSPAGQILSGRTAVTTTRDAALRDRVITGELFQAAAFAARGGGYPRTLMGFLAQLRQFVLDARRHAELLSRFAAGNADRRPPYDPDLDAIRPLLDREQRLLCRADDSRAIRRWLAFSRAENVEIAICGGREAWMVAGELAAAGVPVFLGLDWGDEVPDPDEEDEEGEKEASEAEAGGAEAPDEPDKAPGQAGTEGDGAPQEAGTDPAGAAEPAGEVEEAVETEQAEPNWEYEEPLGVQRERRRRWVEIRDCALRLEDAGVRFAFASLGASAGDLVKNARKLVEAGLSEEAAFAALTTSPAELLGAGERLGRIAVGFDANIAVWSESPMTKKAHLDRLFVDGASYHYEREEEEGGTPAEGVDLTGTWTVTYEEREGPPATLELEMAEGGEVSGSFRFSAPDGGARNTEVSGSVSGNSVRLKASMEMGEFSAEIRLEAEVTGDEMKGDVTWKFSGGENTSGFKAKREPKTTNEGARRGGLQR